MTSETVVSFSVFTHTKKITIFVCIETCIKSNKILLFLFFLDFFLLFRMFNHMRHWKKQQNTLTVRWMQDDCVCGVFCIIVLLGVCGIVVRITSAFASVVTTDMLAIVLAVRNVCMCSVYVCVQWLTIMQRQQQQQQQYTNGQMCCVMYTTLIYSFVFVLLPILTASKQYYPFTE